MRSSFLHGLDFMNPVLNPQSKKFMHISLKAYEHVAIQATTSLNDGCLGGVASFDRTASISCLANRIVYP